MKNAVIIVVAVLVLLGAWYYMNQAPLDQATPSTATESASGGSVTSSDCAGNLEKLRQAGLLEMKARRDAAIAAGTSQVKAEADYQAELKQAAAQFEMLKSQCKDK